MPNMQTVQDAGTYSTSAARSTTTEGIHASPEAMSWLRYDWNSPVGTLLAYPPHQRCACVEGQTVHWRSFEVSRLFLSHRAAMYLLQGLSLRDLLLPSHHVCTVDGTDYGDVGQLLLRVDPWQYWLPTPTITNLVVVAVQISETTPPLDKVLEVLVSSSAS